MKMKIIGLTGGSGAGKGEVCKIFAAYGFESIDTDKISREITRKGGECLEELVLHFSDIILDDNGELDRKKLADIAFASKDKLELLNKITHAHILGECRSRIKNMQEAGKYAVIIDAPVLFESGFNKECDVIISVIAETSVRLERIIKRDNLTAEQAVRRIKNQNDDDFFTANSDYIIYNNGEIENINRQIDYIYTNIIKER
jgi:dephospho-CoA kinase